MEINEAERRAFLKDEYLLLQGQYEDFDRRSITIKGWVATASTVGFGTALAQDQQVFSICILVIVAILSAIIWYLESHWKFFQYAFQARIIEIEAYFCDEFDCSNAKYICTNPPKPFQVYASWKNSYKLNNNSSVSFQKFVQLPYSVIICISVFLIVISNYR